MDPSKNTAQSIIEDFSNSDYTSSIVKLAISENRLTNPMAMLCAQFLGLFGVTMNVQDFVNLGMIFSYIRLPIVRVVGSFVASSIATLMFILLF